MRIPLLKDHHNHPFMYTSLSKGCINLEKIKNKNDALNIFSQGDSRKLTTVIGWYDNFYTFEDGELDKYSPLILFNTSLHDVFINKSAHDYLYYEYPDLIDNINDKEWVEKNLVRILNFLIDLLLPDVEQLKSFYNKMLSLGIWHLEEMTLHSNKEIDIFKESQLLHRTKFWAMQEVFETLSKEEKVAVHGIKVFTDGAFGTRTAKIKREYLGGGYGIMNYSIDEFNSLIEKVYYANKPIAIHAIGDEAIDTTVKILSSFSNLPEVRIEHAQLISYKTAAKVKDLGFKLSMQPNFSVETKIYADRLDKDYCSMLNPFRMLIDNIGFIPGKDLLFGSDGMPHGAETALNTSLFPPLENQKLTIDEFVAGYCLDNYQHGHINVDINKTLQKVKIDIST
jgi:predicted amidohydrolase YtcJ